MQLFAFFPANDLSLHPHDFLNSLQLACGKTGYDYQSVRRWTTLNRLGYGLVECEKIFVPIHRNVHWCLAIINMKDRTFQYLDSFGGMDHAVDTSSWLKISDSCPLQQNGWDCGMFMLKFIDFHSRGIGLCFTQY
uniref:Ubiquitin-like protease family profile domain-containing protein n=1 Tax=Oryza meridionalis TaxID=40149 RepID=A0A0E0D215_9ORYZ